MKKILLATIFIKLSIFAGVVTDGSLGDSVNLTGPDYTIGQELGQVSGSNLFHSFDQFNLMAGESALFTGDSQISNIIGRITGGPSFIDGEIGSSITGANLFLINQAGMIFGKNASLNLTGAFHASTADYLQFSNSERFYSNPIKSSILNASAPESFGFLGNNGSIKIDGANLIVTNDSDLSFSANGLEITNGAQLSAQDGTINLTSLKNGTTASAIDHSDFIGSKTAITNNSKITVSGTGSGSVIMKGGELFIESSKIKVETTGEKNSGIINLRYDDISMSKASAIQSSTKSNATAANILINTKTLILEGISNIESRINVSGN